MFIDVIACLLIGSGGYWMVVGEYALASALFALACALHLVFNNRATIIVKHPLERRRNPE